MIRTLIIFNGAAHVIRSRHCYSLTWTCREQLNAAANTEREVRTCRPRIKKKLNKVYNVAIWIVTM